MVKGGEIVDRRARVQEYFHYPGHQDEDEDEHVITFQSPADCFELADLKAGQNQILANEFFPFPLKHLAIFHYHGNKEMCFEHPDARAKGIVKAVPAGLNPQQHGDDSEIEEENNMRHFARGERDCDNGSATGNGPICCHIQSLPPNHNATHLAAIEVRHRIDVARIINASLYREGSFFIFCRGCVFGCHSWVFNWITGFA